jgi:hypothetical protein
MVIPRTSSRREPADCGHQLVHLLAALPLAAAGLLNPLIACGAMACPGVRSFCSERDAK